LRKFSAPRRDRRPIICTAPATRNSSGSGSESYDETDESRATGRVAPLTQGGQKAGKPPITRSIVSSGSAWRTVTARHDRRATEPSTSFRPAAETLTFNADPGIAVDAGIGTALRAVTGASRIALAAERSGIMADFANRIAAAQASARPQDLAGIVRVLKEQRAAALATAKRNAERESAEKRQAILQGGQAWRPEPPMAYNRDSHSPAP
jgi:hypothetical protein